MYVVLCWRCPWDWGLSWLECGVVSAVRGEGAGVHCGLAWRLCGRHKKTAYRLPVADVMSWGWGGLSWCRAGMSGGRKYVAFLLWSQSHERMLFLVSVSCHRWPIHDAYVLRLVEMWWEQSQHHLLSLEIFMIFMSCVLWRYGENNVWITCYRLAIRAETCRWDIFMYLTIQLC